MNSPLQNKIAVVTGGTKGIGKAIARALAGAGVSVAICGRSQAGVDRALSELKSSPEARIVGHVTNVAKPHEVSKMFDAVENDLGPIDILVNNAGLGIFRSTAELTIDDWLTTLDTNLNGVFYCCREALPRMKIHGGGFIVNISSLAGRNPFAGGSAYNASKFALNGFSEAMMLDHRHDNVRVSYIMPGSVNTEFTAGAGHAGWKIAPEDVAEVVVWVLSMPARTLVSRVEMRPSRPPK